MTKEEAREYNKKYYQSNKKKIIAQVTEYYKANRVNFFIFILPSFVRENGSEGF